MRKFRCGFSLVEILIVIFVLGLLAAIVIPKLTRIEPVDSRVMAYRVMVEQLGPEWEDLNTFGRQAADEGKTTATAIVEFTEPAIATNRYQIQEGSLWYFLYPVEGGIALSVPQSTSQTYGGSDILIVSHEEVKGRAAPFLPDDEAYEKKREEYNSRY